MCCSLVLAIRKVMIIRNSVGGMRLVSVINVGCGLIGITGVLSSPKGSEFRTSWRSGLVQGSRTKVVQRGQDSSSSAAGCFPVPPHKPQPRNE